MGAGTRCGTLGDGELFDPYGNSTWRKAPNHSRKPRLERRETSGGQDKVGSCVRALTLEHAFDSGFL